MERRNTQVFEVEATDLDESIDVSGPTVVVSAAPLQPCVRTSAPTVRHVAPARPPGKPLGTQPPPRRAQQWLSVQTSETAPVGPIPMPGEQASAVVTIVPHAPRQLATRAGEPSSAAATIVEQAPRPLATRAEERSSAAVTIVQQAPRQLATRAGEPELQYSVEREVSALTMPRAAAPRWPRRHRRTGHALVLIIGILAGFVTVLSVVVVGQQRELQANVEPTRRANEACAAYAEEVRTIALELTQAAGDVAAVEQRIGERARSVVNDRGRQRLCTGQADALCPHGDAACVASAVMRLRQALSRR